MGWEILHEYISYLSAHHFQSNSSYAIILSTQCVRPRAENSLGMKSDLELSFQEGSSLNCNLTNFQLKAENEH